MSLREWLDPDRDLRSFDKVEHFAGGFAICCLFSFFLSPIAALWWTSWTAAIYEAGQTDTAHSLRDSSGRRYAGQPGYGFGLVDLAVGILGAIAWLGIRAALRGVLGA